MSAKDEIQYYPFRYLTKLFSEWKSERWPSVIAEWAQCDVHLQRELLLITSWRFPKHFSDLKSHSTSPMELEVAAVEQLKEKMEKFFSTHDREEGIYQALGNAYLVPRDERISTITYRMLMGDVDWEAAAEFLAIFLTGVEAIAVHDHGMNFMMNRPENHESQSYWSRAWVMAMRN